MRRLLLLGLNHATAPLEVREKIAFSSAQRDRALDELKARFPEAETVLLSTCNRVEIYTAREVHGHPRVEQLIEFLAEFHGIDSKLFAMHLYSKNERDAIAHLFSVTCSLDSMVLGETQIIGQVREAYDIAKARGLTGQMLNPLFQRAIAAGKEVMHATSINEGRMSVASVAVSYARQIFDTFEDKTVLNIGAGKMGVLVLQSVAQLRPRRLLICNRSPERAAELATRFGGEAVSFDGLDQHLAAADIVISSTGAPHPIITQARMASLRKAMRYRPIFLIDIALPRDVEPGVGDLENVYLYNIDDLQQVVGETINQRKEAIDSARAIVEKHVEQFLAWQRSREMGPVIDRLSKRYHAIAADEVARIRTKMPNLSEGERALLDELARRIVNKLLHDPIARLRESEGAHSSQFLYALEKLFNLGEETQDSEERKS